MPELINQIVASGAGAGGVVFFVLKFYFRNLESKIDEAKKTATRAHDRIDSHLQKSH